MPRRETESRPSDPAELAVERKFFSELTALEFHDVLELRSQVFVVEQACVYNDVDGRDAEPTTRHLWIRANGTVAAYLRELDDGVDDEGNQVARIGRVVTHPEYRGRGFAADLVRIVIDAHDGSVVLDAQSHLERWYEDLGFARSGEGFTEDGIPHIPMIRRSKSHPVE